MQHSKQPATQMFTTMEGGIQICCTVSAGDKLSGLKKTASDLKRQRGIVTLNPSRDLDYLQEVLDHPNN